MTEQDVYDIFDSDGLLNRKLKNFEFREDQMNMSLDVLDAYRNHGIKAIEAGTGIGKSFAYLVPALWYSFENPEDRTVIATSTINLQKQLIDKDLPALFNAFGKECKVSLAVGRNNYLCLRRLSSEISAIPLFDSPEYSELGRINEFANKTETGLKTDFEGKLDSGVWNSVCSDGDFCYGPKCPFHDQCFYFKAKRNLDASQLIICNHHLLFVDSNSRLESGLDYNDSCILPPFQRLVIDEAHNIERHATDLFTIDYSSNLLRRQLDFIYDTKWKNSNAVRLLDELVPYCSDKSVFEEIVGYINLVLSQAETINMVLLNFLDTNRLEHILLTKENAGKIISEILQSAEELASNIQRLVAKLTVFASKVDGNDAVKVRCEEFKIHIVRIKSISTTLCDFIHYSDWNDDVHYLEIEKRGKIRFVSMKVAPLEVADILREALFKKIDSIICTSATLDLKDNFVYWSKAIGLPVDGKRYSTKVYNSPFDYRHRLMLLTPYNALDFQRDKQEEYAQYLCSSIYDSISSAGGGALVLFTSIKLMEYVYSNVKPRLEMIGLNCFKQGDMDRYSLLETFKNDTDSVLFATDSFWEGVDAPGNTLRMVIITKLPFRMPDEPIYKARFRKLQDEGKSGFYVLSLPDAAMRLKQGFGRVMRHTDDKGIVLILDARIVSSSYGSMMLSILPESYHPETSVESLSEKIESFLF